MGHPQHGNRPAVNVNIGLAALEPFSYTELDDPDESLCDVDIGDLYTHITDRFAKISQAEIDANLKEFNEGISVLAIPTLFLRYPPKFLANYVAF